MADDPLLLVCKSGCLSWSNPCSLARERKQLCWVCDWGRARGSRILGMVKQFTVNFIHVYTTYLGYWLNTSVHRFSEFLSLGVMSGLCVSLMFLHDCTPKATSWDYVTFFVFGTNHHILGINTLIHVSINSFCRLAIRETSTDQFALPMDFSVMGGCGGILLWL